MIDDLRIGTWQLASKPFRQISRKPAWHLEKQQQPWLNANCQLLVFLRVLYG
jgi:hypothetical protein